MRAALRRNAVCATAAAGGCAVMGWLGLYGFAWNDYEQEAQPALHALVSGRVAEFLRLAPSYGGSLIERAPFALIPSLWGGGELAVYRMVALPCLLAAAVLGVWLVARMRARGAPRVARAVALAVCVANPITLSALEIGHPEEVLGACLCVAAVLLAARSAASERLAPTLLAALALGLAIANKESALLAVGPVLAVLPARRRWPCLLGAAAVAGALLAPLLLVSRGTFIAGARAAASTDATIFQPWQIWWFFGHHGALVHGQFGAPHPGYRWAPAWAGTISHPLILAVGAALAVALLVRARRRERGGAQPLPLAQALLALALVLLLRCVLDTWDITYYTLPFLLALLAWETQTAPHRPPALALLCSALAWLSFVWLHTRVSADAQSALFLAWTLPLAGMLALRLARAERTTGNGHLRLLAGQLTTVRSFGRRVSTS